MEKGNGIKFLPKQLDHHNHHDDNKDINNNNSHVDVIPTASNDLLPEGDSSYCVASDQEDMETMWWENFLVNYESEVVDEQMKKQGEEDTGNCFKYYSYGNTASGIEVGQGDKNQISSDWDQLFCDLTLWNVFNFPEPDTCV
ncbi:MYB transcription factor AN2 [Corchorus olitorius]|uniref:MYB transcription factor AN2 n=1 Tax=Corchorus olitorius TaxID=93759 RepID=A0A1R3JLM6_9ROSI|nr:MYB transcription factor AN2 [Corchorus olitorius]